MFSGIVEANVALLEWTPEDRIVLQKPNNFNDLKPGDSLAVNGVCLTLEWHDEHSMRFALGPETLRVTGWSKVELQKWPLNVERSLRMGDRIHGHVMAGHADSVGTVQLIEPMGDSCNIRVRVPESLARYVWKKGSLAINGVSLTINDLENGGEEDRARGLIVSLCLVPETLKRTNLSKLRIGDKVILEADTMARAWIRQMDFDHGCNA